MLESFTVVLYSEHFLSIDNRRVVANGDAAGGGGRWKGGMDWEFGVGWCELVYREWISNRSCYIALGTISHILCLNQNGKDYEKE